MTFLAFRSANVIYRNLRTSSILNFFMVMGIYSIVLIVEIHRSSTVTVNTPSHRQTSKLFGYFHLLDRTMAGLTRHTTGHHVLLVTKENVIGQIVNPNPWNWALYSFLHVVGQRFHNMIPLTFRQSFTPGVHFLIFKYILICDPFGIDLFHLILAKIFIILDISIGRWVVTN